MFFKTLFAIAALASIAPFAAAQQSAARASGGRPATSPPAARSARQPVAAEATRSTTPAWRAPSSAVRPASNNVPVDRAPLAPVTPDERPAVARVSKGPGSLPNDAGQEWRDYDITPYTARVTSTNRPEQALVDWLLRETGYEAWHSEPLGLLSANQRTLRVYHTPQMHTVVGDMVDRFVNSQAESHAFGLRVITLGSPNWRAKAHAMLRPVATQSQGVQAWVLAKEDAALLSADLRKRTDFREHSSPHLLVNNGQSTVVASTRPRNYVRNVLVRAAAWPGFEPELAQIDEGFSLEFSPLLSLDTRTIDAVIKCNVDQVEKMIPVMIEVPTAVAPRQRTKIEVPQVNSCRLHERFRWPADQVLLISLGVVASPTPKPGNPLVAALPLGLASRADLLVFVESRAASPSTPGAPSTASRDANNYRGRY